MKTVRRGMRNWERRRLVGHSGIKSYRAEFPTPHPMKKLRTFSSLHSVKLSKDLASGGYNDSGLPPLKSLQGRPKRLWRLIKKQYEGLTPSNSQPLKRKEKHQ
ncbi:unnamed protein product [Sphenostylis stenocarpa]|uniref:Uncharacterized protein n=1 Tax=Sphenostylis stenocarpa TaxID=92480 RepID=A0AA86W3D9_9FABA|nr:unnamed protein product [Sphenostylis stenocarpa]